MKDSEAWTTLVSLLANCRNDPHRFNELFLGRSSYWSAQKEICESIVKYRSTVVYSGNMIGKDYVIGGIVPWWLATRPESLIIVTGPSQTILGSVTWKEIRRALENARVPFGGRLSNGIKASPQVVEIAPAGKLWGFPLPASSVPLDNTRLNSWSLLRKPLVSRSTSGRRLTHLDMSGWLRLETRSGRQASSST